LESGKRRREPTDLPLFLYKGYKYDPNDEIEGLCESQLLVNCYKVIYLGPSSWGPEGSKTKRAAKGSLSNLSEVTGRTIAYVATLVSQIEWNFFWTIVSFFEDPAMEEEATAMLKWWNQ
ncbi:hypothetical protein M422DRAFT_122493, partial [Sphaerobolus stellatus SS14]